MLQTVWLGCEVTFNSAEIALMKTGFEDQREKKKTIQGDDKLGFWDTCWPYFNCRTLRLLKQYKLHQI